MSTATILVLSAGLAMDATAVAALRGMAAQAVTARDVVLIASIFGLFHCAMPGVGWFVGGAIGPVVEAWDHWIAFGLLGVVGGKMLWDAWSQASAGESEQDDTSGDFSLAVLLPLGLATSIDAIAVGISLPMLHAPPVATLACMGGVTATFTAIGVLAGRRFGAALGRRLDALGGLVLIGLGAKILVGHLGLL